MISIIFLLLFLGVVFGSRIDDIDKNGCIFDFDSCLADSVVLFDEPVDFLWLDYKAANYSQPSSLLYAFSEVDISIYFLDTNQQRLAYIGKDDIFSLPLHASDAVLDQSHQLNKLKQIAKEIYDDSSLLDTLYTPIRAMVDPLGIFSGGDGAIVNGIYDTITKISDVVADALFYNGDTMLINDAVVSTLNRAKTYIQLDDSSQHILPRQLRQDVFRSGQYLITSSHYLRYLSSKSKTDQPHVKIMSVRCSVNKFALKYPVFLFFGSFLLHYSPLLVQSLPFLTITGTALGIVAFIILLYMAMYRLGGRKALTWSIVGSIIVRTAHAFGFRFLPKALWSNSLVIGGVIFIIIIFTLVIITQFSSTFSSPVFRQLYLVCLLSFGAYCTFKGFSHPLLAVAATIIYISWLLLPPVFRFFYNLSMAVLSFVMWMLDCVMVPFCLVESAINAILGKYYEYFGRGTAPSMKLFQNFRHDIFGSWRTPDGEWISFIPSKEEAARGRMSDASNYVSEFADDYGRRRESNAGRRLSTSSNASYYSTWGEPGVPLAPSRGISVGHASDLGGWGGHSTAYYPPPGPSHGRTSASRGERTSFGSAEYPMHRRDSGASILSEGGFRNELQKAYDLFPSHSASTATYGHMGPVMSNGSRSSAQYGFDPSISHIKSQRDWRGETEFRDQVLPPTSYDSKYYSEEKPRVHTQRKGSQWEDSGVLPSSPPEDADRYVAGAKHRGKERPTPSEERSAKRARRGHKVSLPVIQEAGEEETDVATKLERRYESDSNSEGEDTLARHAESMRSQGKRKRGRDSSRVSEASVSKKGGRVIKRTVDALENEIEYHSDKELEELIESRGRRSMTRKRMRLPDDVDDLETHGPAKKVKDIYSMTDSEDEFSTHDSELIGTDEEEDYAQITPTTKITDGRTKKAKGKTMLENSANRNNRQFDKVSIETTSDEAELNEEPVPRASIRRSTRLKENEESEQYDNVNSPTASSNKHADEKSGREQSHLDEEPTLRRRSVRSQIFKTK